MKLGGKYTMAKIVYNACYGVFGLSHEAVLRYAELKGITLYHNTESRVFTHYYLCPPEEFKRLQDEDHSNPIRQGRYERSNAMYFSPSEDIERNDPALVQVVEELGDKANTKYSKLRIAEVPAGTLYRIDEYDGQESVETKDTYDWKVA
jgi:hypothetical protein